MPKGLYHCVATAALTVAIPAWAGEAPAGQPQQTDGGQDQGAQNQAGQDQPAQAETRSQTDGDILVTARRRDERLSDVPAAASVIDAGSLAERGGATSSGELLADQPSVRFNNLNSSITSEISIRASSTARATNGDPSIGLFRNGSYIAGGAIGGRNFARIDLLDIGRVEVLRGTQGALYGRNAVGGAINVISARPEFRSEGFVTGRYSFENEAFQLQGAVNTALSDTVAIRLSGDLIQQDKGFFYNPTNDVYFDRQKGYGLRGQVRVRTGPLDLILLAETQDLATPTISYQVAIAAGTPGFPGGFIQPRFSYAWSTPPRATQNVDSYQAIATLDLGGPQLSSTTLYRQRGSQYDLDNDGINPADLAAARADGRILPTLPLDAQSASFIIDDTDIFTQDLHLNGTAAGGAFTWLVGADYVRLDSKFSVATTRTPTLANPSTGDIVRSRLRFDSWGVYGSAGYDFTAALNLTGELRYTRDDRSITSGQFALLTGAPSGGASRIINAAINADNLAYNVTGSYKLGGGVLAYAKIGSSYRAGGFNTRLSDPRAPSPVQVLFGNENSTSYEIGVKGSPARRTYFAVAGYYTALKDLIAQVDDGCFIGSAVCPVNAVSYLTNAGNARSWGVETELTQRFDLGAGNGRLSLSASRQGGEVTSGRYNGLPLAQVPDWLASANLNLRYPVGGDVTLTGNVLVSTQFGGKQELLATSFDLDDYQLVNLRLGAERRGITLSVFANNVFDQIYRVARAATINRYNQPRVIGVDVGYRW